MKEKYSIIIFKDKDYFDDKIFCSEIFINEDSEIDQAIIQTLKDINAELEFDYPAVYVSFKSKKVAEKFIDEVIDPLLLAEKMTNF